MYIFHITYSGEKWYYNLHNMQREPQMSGKSSNIDLKREYKICIWKMSFRLRSQVISWNTAAAEKSSLSLIFLFWMSGFRIWYRGRDSLLGRSKNASLYIHTLSTIYLISLILMVSLYVRLELKKWHFRVDLHRYGK